MFRPIALLGAALLSIFAPPPPNDVRPLLANAPAAGIVVATLDQGRSQVRSYSATLNGDSPFEIGSLTKTFTATLFALMIERREVAASDPIERYLPPGSVAPTFAGHRITLEDLATQTSGLPRLPTNLAPADAADPYADYGPSRLGAFLASYKLTRAPGASFEYSNLGYGLLGYLLARRLKVDYAGAIRRRILEPLGMSHTYFEIAGHTVHTVQGYDADGDPVANWHFDALAGAGAMVSTPNDMLLFARANLAGGTDQLSAALRMARRPRRSAGWWERIGYAWLIASDRIAWHNGGTAGFRTFLGLDAVHARAALVFANASLDAVDPLGFHLLDPARPFPHAPPADFALDDATLRSYAGQYRFSDGSIATIAKDERGLTLSLDKPRFHARLHAVAAGEFAIPAQQIDIRFATAGAETKLILTQANQPPESAERVAK